jgi:hypothetical protein
LKLDGTHQVLVYADYNLLEKNVHTIKNTESLLVTSKEICLELNAEKTKYMLMCHEQNAGQSHNKKIGNKSTEIVAKFKYLGTALTNQNCIDEEIKCRLNPGNACYLSVQNLLSACLLSKNIQIKIYKTISVACCLYISVKLCLSVEGRT